MKICFISTEIFAWGKYGGFGRATRLIGSELAKRGFEIFAVIPKRNEQRDYEMLDGVKVLGFPVYNPFYTKRLFHECDADIFHSEEPSFGTYIAMKEMPYKIHIVTSRDPRNLIDWIKEFNKPSFNKLQVCLNFIYENNFLVTASVKNAAKVFCPALFLREKIQKKYRLDNSIDFLPTPIKIPQQQVIKSITPAVCYLGRLDRRKRPELFFNLAESFSEIKFIVIGKSRDRNYENYLKEKYSKLKNLEVFGFLDQFESNKISEILSNSWILINTSTREGLPNSFLEALAHKCALLSSLNPENIVKRFGFFVKDNNYAIGLTKLLENDNWRSKGELGQNYVKENYELNMAVEKHIDIYNKLLNNSDLRYASQ